MGGADVHAVASARLGTTGLAMPPTRALTTRFEIDGDDSGAAGPLPGAAGSSSGARSEARQGFSVGELRLMIRYEDASELTELPTIHRLPSAPAWFRGIANLRGKLTPVFDLASYLGVDPDPTAKRMLLVLAHGSDAGGVLIDGQPERLRWSAEDRADVGTVSERLRPHLRGASDVGGRVWLELDARSLLAEFEHALETSQ